MIFNQNTMYNFLENPQNLTFCPSDISFGTVLFPNNDTDENAWDQEVLHFESLSFLLPPFHYYQQLLVCLWWSQQHLKWLFTKTTIHFFSKACYRRSQLLWQTKEQGRRALWESKLQKCADTLFSNSSNIAESNPDFCFIALGYGWYSFWYWIQLI